MALTDLDAPKTIEKKDNRVTVPSTRISNAEMTRNRIQRLIEADAGRARRRALVKGLVDGNPPYQAAALVSAGRAYQCNVNWRESESYLGQAVGAFYDVFSEVPNYATVTGNYGNPDEQVQWGRTVTEKFHYLLKCDDEDDDDWSWDYQMQISQHEMVLYGNGPIWFNDETDWRCEASLHSELKVPEMAKSAVQKWEEATRLCTYYPHELYTRILNESAAKDIGWDVNTVKQAIIDAHPRSHDTANAKSWEWHQDRLKNQSFEYSAESSVIETAHYFVKEFPTSTDSSGSITHTIVLLNHQSSNATKKYLYKKERCYKNWRKLIHPMYYANDGGGYHHSVTGMGIKMYSAMEYKNRLLCNASDKAFAPKIMFKPTSAQVQQQLSIVQFGDYGTVPAGFDIVQTPTGSFLEEPIMMNREISRIVSSNLSQYRQELRKEDGNPATATQIVHDASQQAKLGKTQLARYYEQMDAVYNEMFKRAATQKNKSLPGGVRAAKFQDECKEAGVPPEFLKNASAKATRITGQGSDFMRQQSLEFLLQLVAMLPESGRENLLQDVIAARAGQQMVKRYYPAAMAQQKPTDHHAIATLQVAAMKEGVPPVVTGTQNHVIYAQVFLEAAAMGAQLAAQGKGNPVEALAFIDLAGPAILQHLDAIKADKTRKSVYDALFEQWKELGKIYDQLLQMVQQATQKNGENREAQARAQQMRAGQDPEMQLKAEELRAKLTMAQQKTNVGLRQKEEKHQQAKALADAKTAEEIRRTRAKDAAQQENGNAE